MPSPAAASAADPVPDRAAGRRAAGRRSADPADPAGLSDRDISGLVFTGEMYGVQLDQLAVVLGTSPARTRAIVASWRGQRLAESARLGPGTAWVWLTRAGLASCGLAYTAGPPALSRLAHIRAVTAVRLALEATPGYRAAGAYWRGERRLRARGGGRVGLREHFPDGEVHWPSAADLSWAGECWAIEAELTRKTMSRTMAIMRDLLTRTGDYGSPAADARVPGRPPRHARALYVCAPAALATVTRARQALGAAGARIEIRRLPADAAWPAPSQKAPAPTTPVPTTPAPTTLATRTAVPQTAVPEAAVPEAAVPEAPPGQAGRRR